MPCSESGKRVPDDHRQSAHQNKKNEGLLRRSFRDAGTCLLTWIAVWTWGEHAAAVYRSPCGSATGSHTKALPAEA